MKKELIISIVIIILIIGGFSIWNSPSENNLDGIEDNETKDSFSHSNDPHWRHMPLTYKFSRTCVGLEPDRVRWAFEIVSNRTNNALRFVEINYGEPDIQINCHKKMNKPFGSSAITLAESTPYFDENIITNAEIEIYSVSENSYPQSCSTFPNLEISQILRTFGFVSSELPTSVMFPYQDGCWQTRIDDVYLDKIEEIYG